MAQFYYRENGIRGTMISGPFASLGETVAALRSVGLKVRDVGFLRKEGANLVKISPPPDQGLMRNVG